MKGYLMQELAFVPGEDNFVESFSPENNYGVVFEDDGETAYFYAVEKDKPVAGGEAGAGNSAGVQHSSGLRILDALHIYEVAEFLAAKEAIAGAAAGAPPKGRRKQNDQVEKTSRLLIIWSRDWMKCALVIDGQCQAIFDFASHGGYNINEFPPPNDIWTKGDRKLTDELIRELF